MKNFAGLLFALTVIAVVFLASCQNTRTVRYPYGPASFDLIDQDSTVSISVSNTLSYFEIDTLTQATTVNASVSSSLLEGSMLYLKMRSDTTGRTVTLGTNFEGTTIAGTASKVKVAGFIWDGDNFVHLSTQQLD